jgi:RNAse (barnase) inhibitor barstar
MKTCVLDGSRLADADGVYRRLAEAFGFPPHFGNNPDALWDALGEYGGATVNIVWRDAGRSAERFGAQFEAILGVLQRAAADGLLTIELS